MISQALSRLTLENPRLSHLLSFSLLGWAPVVAVIGAILFLSACQPKSARELTILEEKAAEGDGTAQYRLGTLYFFGHETEQDLEKARDWYTAAAHQGIVSAQFDLAEMYRLGIGIPQNRLTAAHWYLEAADRGHEGAKALLDFVTEISPKEEIHPLLSSK